MDRTILFLAALLLTSKSEKVRIGDKVTLKCHHTDNVRTGEVHKIETSLFWRLPDGTNRETPIPTLLTIENLTTTHLGLYECHVLWKWIAIGSSPNTAGSVSATGKTYLRLTDVTHPKTIEEINPDNLKCIVNVTSDVHSKPTADEMQSDKTTLLLQSRMIACKSNGKEYTDLTLTEDCADEDLCKSKPKPLIHVDIVANQTHYLNFTWLPKTSKRVTCQSKILNEPKKCVMCVEDLREEFVTGNIFKINKGNYSLTELNVDKWLTIEEGVDLMLTCMRSYCESEAPRLRWVFFNTVNGRKGNVTNIYSKGISSIRADVVLWDSKVLDSGTYTCIENGFHSKVMEIRIQPAGPDLLLVSAPVFVFIGIALLALPVVYLRRLKRQLKEFQCNIDALRAFQKGDVNAIQSDISIYQQADLLPFNREWEFPREKLRLGRTLGEGFFGKVLEGEAAGIIMGEEKTTVAVKTTKRNAEREDALALEKELKIMSNLGCHPHVVNLIGAVVDRLAQNDLMLIVEYCHFGSLLSYIRRNRGKFNKNIEPLAKNRIVATSIIDYTNTIDLDFNRKVLLQWSYQIACGMEWLAMKHILHCDLAARNVLLTEDNTVKIGDFGQAHDLYTKRQYIKEKECKLPLKWMAIESVEERVFTTQSDVWSYGVLLWELFSLGCDPYPGFASFREIWKAIIQGYRMEKPEHATELVYSVMVNCWKKEASARPAFTTLASIFLEQMDYEKQEHPIKVVPKTEGPIYMPTSGRLTRRPTVKERMRSMTFSGRPRSKLTDTFYNRSYMKHTTSLPRSCNKSATGEVAMILSIPTTATSPITDSGFTQPKDANYLAFGNPEYREPFFLFTQSQLSRSPEYAETVSKCSFEKKQSAWSYGCSDAVLELKHMKSQSISTNLGENHYTESPLSFESYTPDVKQQNIFESTSKAWEEKKSEDSAGNYLDPFRGQKTEYLEPLKKAFEYLEPNT